MSIARFVKDWLQALLLLTMGTVASVHVARHGFSAQWVTAGGASFLFLAVLLKWESPRRSKVFSEVVETTFWGLIWVVSLIHDTTAGFQPMLFGILFFWSAYLLYVTVRDRNHPVAN